MNDPKPQMTGLPQMRVCILMTCFNRKEMTLACLRSVQRNLGIKEACVTALVLDDASTDGTPEAILAEFPWAEVVVCEEGNLYWCRGMHKAFEIALSRDYDYFLWLNDDTMLQPDALIRLLACEAELKARAGDAVIVVGSTVDPKTGQLTYGGENRASALRRTRFVRVQPEAEAQRCDSMNGNIVLISRQAAMLVGNLDPAFEHAMGDTDYALRANKKGVFVWVAPGIYGTCSDNPRHGTFMDPDLPLLRRFALIMSRKGLPWRSWLVLTRRHTGFFWPLYFVWPYVGLLVGKYGRIN